MTTTHLSIQYTSLRRLGALDTNSLAGSQSTRDNVKEYEVFFKSFRSKLRSGISLSIRCHLLALDKRLRVRRR